MFLSDGRLSRACEARQSKLSIDGIVSHSGTLGPDARRPRALAPVTPGPFRQTARERSAPAERLDAPVTLTPPHAWVALATILVLLGGVVAWSVLGSVPTAIRAQGILTAEGGLVQEAAAEGAGMVEAVLVRPGEVVERGQVIARITQPELAQSIAAAEEVVRERQADLERVRGFVEEQLRRQGRAIGERRGALDAILAAAREREAQLGRQLAAQEALLAQGVATRPATLAARAAANQASQDVADARNALAQLDIQLLDLTGQQEQRVSDAERALADARRRVQELALRLERQREVRAPAAGRVTEIRAPRGSTLRQGGTVLAIEDGASALELVAFVPPTEGRRVRPGMSVRISPAGVRWEEHGALVGTVLSVAEFPATREGLASILRNDVLVQDFTRTGAPYIARVRLEPDPASASGYRWTSARGAALGVASGTLASADIRLREQAPITLVLPLLRDISRIEF